MYVYVYMQIYMHIYRYMCIGIYIYRYIYSLFVYLVIRKSILNIDSSHSLVDKLTLFSDLND